MIRLKSSADFYFWRNLGCLSCNLLLCYDCSLCCLLDFYRNKICGGCNAIDSAFLIAYSTFYIMGSTALKFIHLIVQVLLLNWLDTTHTSVLLQKPSLKYLLALLWNQWSRAPVGELVKVYCSQIQISGAEQASALRVPLKAFGVVKVPST